MVLNVTESITKPGEFDLFQFEATKGKKLRLEIESRQYGYELDPVITVFDANGKKLAEKDDRSKTEPDPVLDFAIPSSGSYFVRVKDVGDAGGKRFYYRLQINAVVPDFELSVAKSSLVVTEKTTRRTRGCGKSSRWFRQGNQCYSIRSARQHSMRIGHLETQR